MTGAKQQRRTAGTTGTARPGWRGVSVEWSLAPGDAEAARTIRHRITECLRQAAAEGADLDSAAVVVGELLSNIVQHTSSPAVIGLSWDGPHPELRVFDAGLETAPPDDTRRPWQLPADPLATNGRGLYLVSQLARELNVTGDQDHGTTITVVLDVARAN